MSCIAATPAPPYYAVIFTSLRSDDLTGYVAMSAHLTALAAQQPGYLGMESLDDAHTSITVSYWQSLDAISAWKRNLEHHEAQRLGREQWYRSYKIRICRVERDYAVGVSM